jgi:hypothetical protein
MRKDFLNEVAKQSRTKQTSLLSEKNLDKKFPEKFGNLLLHFHCYLIGDRIVKC